MTDMAFPAPARRPSTPTAQAYPTIQLANNAKDVTLGTGANQRRIFSGFLIEKGQDDALDQAITNHIAQAGTGGREPLFTERAIYHPSSGNTVRHWSAARTYQYVICSGIQSRQEMKRTDERLGIAFGWTAREDGRPMSVLRARTFLLELLAMGYQKPLVLTIKGTRTDDYLDAATGHFDALDRAVDLGLLSPNAAFYAAALPVMVDDNAVMRGEGAHSQEVAPLRSLHPAAAEMDEAYLRKIIIRPAWADMMNRLLTPTIQWSIEESKIIPTQGQRRSPDGTNI